MANMEHCRFSDTLDDLRDCWEHWDDHLHDGDMSPAERKAQSQLLKLCATIYNAATDDPLDR